MQEKWLPGNTMDRIRDLCRSRNITQVELAQAVGMDKSTLSRVMAEKTSKLSSKNLVAIANYFEVSTDFLLGLTDIPARKEHDIERLGLSVEAAANLHQGKLNHSVVCQLLENPKFAELTRQIALYQEGVLASGVAANASRHCDLCNDRHRHQGGDHCRNGCDDSALCASGTRADSVNSEPGICGGGFRN